VGRATDVAAIVEVLLARRSVTIVGPGGVGKTAVVKSVVAELADKFPRPIIVDAAGAGAGALLDEIARLVGADRHPQLSANEALGAGLGDQTHLVVIDTCEARRDEVHHAVEVLSEHPCVFTLLASREPVRHRGEHLHRMSGLEHADARALLRVLIGTGADTDGDVLERLARRVDGLPLALTMLAPRIAALGAAAVFEEVDNTTSMLTRGPSGGIPERHRSIEALVQWSLDPLDEQARQLLMRCAALHGDFPLEALNDLDDHPAASVGESVGSTLAVLVDASLVSRRGDAPATFAVLDTVRDGVRRRYPEGFAAEQRRVDAHVVAQAWADYTGAQELPVADWVASRFGTTLDRLLVEPDHQALMLAIAAARRWLDRGSLAQGSAALQRALTATPNVAPSLASIGWLILGFNQLYQGEVQSALRSYRTAATTVETVPAEGVADLVAATVAWLECDFAASWRIAKSAAERMSTPTRRAPANLVAFAKFALFAGDLDGASECYARALRFSREVGDPVVEADAVRLAAVVAALRGDHHRALSDALRAAALHDAAASTMGSAQAASTVALVAALGDDFATAAAWADRAMARLRRQLDVQTVCVVIPVIAAIDVASGRVERAARLVGWVDRYVHDQQHVRHPTAAALFANVDRAIESLDAADRRRWTAEGAALSAAQMIELATE